jgi:hypothetical protein
MKSSLFFVSWLLSVNFSLYAQTQDKADSDTILSTNKINFEKVYLHLDRTHFEVGEDIWFKAYLVDATTNKLISYDRGVHVDLYSADLKLIAKEIILLTDGSGNGDFSIDEDLPSGTYFIRAYTNWMRNFGDLFFYTKAIEINNPYAKNQSNKKTNDNDEKTIDVQFMPESGSLIEDVLSDVGFKGVDQNGIGIDVNGVIISSFGDIVAAFNSKHLGMGRFSFIPKHGLSYYATGITKDGNQFKVPLPSVKETGYNLHIIDVSDAYFKIVLRTNLATLKNKTNGMMYLSCVTRNNLCLAQKIPSDTTISTVFISKKNFPEGITCLTIYGSDLIPQCERLFYVHKKETTFLTVTNDKSEYRPKEKTDLTISVKDSASNDVAANLSMAITEMDDNKQNKYNSNICTSFLLESDLRGKVEEASYYFDVTKPDRFNSLDLLLLTQGWRNYIWKQLPDSITHIDFPVKTGITISGRLRQNLINNAIPNATITMVLMDSLNTPIFQYTNTDKEGKFSFEGLSFVGKRELILNATSEKGKQKGWLQLDSVNKKLSASKIKIFDEIPKTDKIVQEQQEEQIVISTQAKDLPIIKNTNATDSGDVGQTDMKSIRKRKFSLKDTIPIDQVEVRAKKYLIPDDGRYRRYGGVPALVIDDAAGIQEFLSIIGLNLGNGFKRMNNRPLPMDKKGRTLILVDGMEVPVDMLWLMIPSEISRIELLTRSEAIMFGEGVTNVISIFSKKSTPLDDQIHSYVIKKEIEGYYRSREFYNPVFDGKDTPDPRTETVLWKPDIVTDSIGKAQISYYNTKRKALIHVQVEGLTNGGVPVVGTLDYLVK